jgi:tetratricopeptide (TPR) repeat protein
VCEGTVVGRGIAREHRTDLAQAGYGDGTYAFDLPLSYELSDGNVHTLSAREAVTRKELGGEPVVFGPKPSDYDFDLIARKEGLLQTLDVISRKSSNLSESRRANYIEAYHLSALLQETGSLNDARFAWESLDKALGKNAFCQCKIAETYLLDGQFEKALESYLSAASEDLTFVWAHLGIGNSQRMLGKTAAAKSAYNVALSLQPKNEIIRLRLVDPIDAITPEMTTGAMASDFQSLVGLLVQSGKNSEAWQEPCSPAQRLEIRCAELLPPKRLKQIGQELKTLKSVVEKMNALRDLKNHE